MKLYSLAEKQQKATFNKWLNKYFRRSWWRMLVLLLITLMGVGFDLLNPWPLKILADSVFGHLRAPGPLASLTGSERLLYVVALLYVAIYGMQNLMNLLKGYLASRFSFRLDIQVKKRLFDHILHLPARSPSRLEVGDYIYRQNVETDAVSTLILSNYVTVFQSMLTIIGVLGILLFLNWRLALLCLSIMPFLYLSLRFFGPKIEQRATVLEELTSVRYNLVEESVQNTDIVQSFNRQAAQSDLLLRVLDKQLLTQLRYNLLIGIFGFFTSMLTVIAIVAIVVVGGHAVFAGSLTFGGLLIFIIYSGYLYGPLESLGTAFADIRQHLASIRRVFTVINDQADLENITDGQILERAAGNIEFKNVSFSYGDKLILSDVDLRIAAGEKVAFIGPSGAGKSTLLTLLLRFTMPDRGFIYLDGMLLTDINLKSLRQQIALVDQEPKLFSLSIADNIAFARPDEPYPLPDIIAAAYSAHATEFIEKLPEKYDQSIEHSGKNLSGGQKQRIAIARAFFKRAPILVLDEPTSAQDVASEERVLDALSNLMINKTVLLVTHNLSLLNKMDKVYVVDNGLVTPVEALGGIESYVQRLHSTSSI